MRCTSQQAVNRIVRRLPLGKHYGAFSEGGCDHSVRLQNQGYPPNPKLRGARMFAVIILIVIALVLSYNAYLIWYAKSGRYDFDQRFDSVTKR